MKKLLIISYYFPPCNLTAAKRVGGWAENLHKYGFYPIVVTRRWDVPINSLADISKGTGTEKSVEKNKHCTIYRVPYAPSLRDRIINKYSMKRLVALRRVLSFAEVILRNFSLKSVAYENLYDTARQLIAGDPELRRLIVSGNPFQQFSFGYRLKKEFSDLKWIADYRDEWTTHKRYKKSGLEGIVRRIEQRNERKWVSTASCFTYVNDAFISRISKFVERKGVVIRNGFEDIEIPDKRDANSIRLTFGGTLYPHQDVRMLARGVTEFIETNRGIDIKLYFLGSALIDGTKERIEAAFSKIGDRVIVTNRKSKSEMLEYYSKTDAFLMFPPVGMEGVVPSKILDYFPARRPIILCPSDDNEIARILTETGLGLIVESPIEVCRALERIRDAKMRGEHVELPMEELEIEKYSREHQHQVLAKVLETI